MSTSRWSDDRITALRTLWREGQSSPQIAAALGGVTRNAVIGKIHRLGLSGRAAPSTPARAPRGSVEGSSQPPRAAGSSPRRRGAVPPPFPPMVAPEGPGLIADMALLRAHACKWPIGDPKAADFSFCGRFAAGRYCLNHEGQGVQPGKVWRADRDPTVRRALAGLI